MAYAPAVAPRPSHPVRLEVEYPERLSRGLIFVKLLLAVPHFIVVWLLTIPLYILTILAWFSILFTARYPKWFFDFTSGIFRWQSNVAAYVGLLRDEYPPFSIEPVAYPLTLEIARADRQSRFRLFIRAFAILPNQLVFLFVQIAWAFVTLIAWFAILLTGRYPRGLFKFSVGSLRWYQRQQSYYYLLRDEYPPYSINADARPGNEVVSAIVGLPLFAAYAALQFLPYVGLLGGGNDIVTVDTALLDRSGALRSARPSGEANNLRLTLVGYDDAALAPPGSGVELETGYRLIAFHLIAEKDGFLPTFFTPFLFFLEDCYGTRHGTEVDAVVEANDIFHAYWRRGRDDATVFFQIPRGAEPCELMYFSGFARIRFQFY